MRIITNSLHIATGVEVAHRKLQSLQALHSRVISRSLWIWLAWNRFCCKFDDCSLHYDRKATHNTGIRCKFLFVDIGHRHNATFAVSFLAFLLWILFFCFFCLWFQLWIIFFCQLARNGFRGEQLKKRFFLSRLGFERAKCDWLVAKTAHGLAEKIAVLSLLRLFSLGRLRARGENAFLFNFYYIIVRRGGVKIIKIKEFLCEKSINNFSVHFEGSESPFKTARRRNARAEGLRKSPTSWPDEEVETLASVNTVSGGFSLAKCDWRPKGLARDVIVWIRFCWIFLSDQRSLSRRLKAINFMTRHRFPHFSPLFILKVPADHKLRD